MRAMKSADSTKKTHHHHRDDPSVAARAKAKIRAKNDEESDEEYDEDNIPGLNPLPRKVKSLLPSIAADQPILLIVFYDSFRHSEKKRKTVGRRRTKSPDRPWPRREAKSASTPPWP